MSRDAKHSGGIAMYVVISVMACVGITLALLALISTVTVSGKVGESQSAKLIPAVWGFSGMLIALIGKKMNGKENKWLPVYTMSGYAGAVLACGMLAFEGVLYKPWQPMVCIVAGFVLGSGLRRGGNKKRKRRSAAR